MNVLASTQLRTPVPLLDVARENGPLEAEIQQAISRVVASGRFVLGPECEELETQLALRVGSSFAVGCASGSDALLLALMAMGIGHGDQVLLPSFTFFATASAVTRLGAKPVFVDIDPDTFNLDADHLQARIVPRTRVVIPVHLFGQCADMTRILAIADAANLHVLEDCAQAIDATFQGQPAGSLGLAGCFSFYPTKNLGGFGDGGMVTTSDAELAEKLRLYRAHGMKPRYQHHVVGINSRLDTLQAAVLLTKLPHLHGWHAARARNAARYAELFAEAGLEGKLVVPTTASRCESVWNQYTVRVLDGHRDRLRKHLAELGIGSEIYYPTPLHLQPCFREYGYREGSLPETERTAKEVLSLPIFPALTAAEQRAVVEGITAYFAA